MSPLKRQAHFAGLLYVLGAIVAPFGLIYIPTKLIVRGDAAATADNIRASETLFRLGIASEVTGAIIFIFVVLALYHLFKGVNQKHALAMATLLTISYPISFVGAASNLVALDLVRGADYLAVFEGSQLDSLSYVFLRLHSQALTIASIFWGLWLFPFGWLVIRSGFIPRVLGVLLMIAGSGYVIDAFATLVLPEVAERLATFLMITAFAEAPIMFWLLIWGAREKPAVAAAA
jgi:hypothetical protein